MKVPPRPGSQGFSLLEWMIALSIIGVLVAVADMYLDDFEAQAERSAFRNTLTQLQVAAIYVRAEHVATDTLDSLSQRLRENPVQWLDRPPPGRYLGALESPDFDELPTMSWHYDTASGYLVYKAEHVDALRNADPLPSRIRLQLALRFDDRDGDGMLDARDEPVTAFALEPVDDYEWRRSGR